MNFDDMWAEFDADNGIPIDTGHKPASKAAQIAGLFFTACVLAVMLIVVGALWQTAYWIWTA
jgi:hypothetical protein